VLGFGTIVISLSVPPLALFIWRIYNSFKDRYLNRFDKTSRYNRIQYSIRLIAFLLFASFVSAIFSSLDYTAGVFLLSIFLSILIIALYLYLVIKRLHDLNLSGWYALMIFIPITGAIFSILLLTIIPGTKDPGGITGAMIDELK
tara:strand:+ start:6012 stop:6446 length:435 start_codon:yes stop_codon:yes gene_type:complete